ncbi:putative lipid II flippase FtsW [Fluviispira sanaruensis]|uniref:Probable peptidoglycan glycosyltransferase FtsW n=1 Tax=Fluviispira sanaruensis TaxID=2493639 RepID=A0A4P2VJC8_FLUSA|nr:putative lipid II flippase FtsW [Fluviispira sanaruensis]BBH51650.1 putative lipid II flippase FtsW [Fluviispira sanaruensis]
MTSSEKMNTSKEIESESKKIENILDNSKPSTWITYGGNVLWVPVIALTGFGILFVYSASSVYSAQHYGTEFYFAKKQAFFLLPSLLAALAGAMIPFELYYKFIKYLFFILVTMTFATHLPGIGRKVYGASRWLNLGIMPIQPSEFLRVFSIMYMVWIISKQDNINKKYIESKKYPPLIEYGCLLLAPIAIIAQKDLGTTVVVITGCLGVLFINGLPKRYFAGIFGILIFGLISAILFEPYRIARVMTFLNPFKDPLGSGFQVIQSFVAVANGGLFGRGIGESQQKLFFLPEAHTDFILAVITEEMGFIGILVLAILYSVLYYAILRLVIYGSTHRDRLLATGAFAMLVITTIINMGVVAGALPTKGLPLPFISNGGSALIANYFIIGLMSQISRRIYLQNNQLKKAI